MKNQIIIIAAVVCVIAFTGAFSLYEVQSNSAKWVPVLASNEPSPVPVAKQVTNGIGSFGPITFKLLQNSTTMKVSPGSSVTDSIPINIIDNAPMRFLIDDTDINSSKSTIPSGITVSMQVFGKSYQPEFQTQTRPVSINNTLVNPEVGSTSVSTQVGESSIPYTISVANNVPVGTYLLKFDLQSFSPMPSYTIGTVEYDKDGKPHAGTKVVQGSGLMSNNGGAEFQVTLNVQ
jgi:hypothetical protein